MGEVDEVRIETLDDHEDAQVRAMLVDLALAEQQHFDHPEETSEQLNARLSTSPTFSGENHILVARTPDGEPLGLCWVVLTTPVPVSRRRSPSCTSGGVGGDRGSLTASWPRRCGSSAVAT